jgi:phosphoenolpyruvate carboxykinase (ATP)
MSLDRQVLSIPTARLKSNRSRAVLYEEAVQRGEGLIAADGPLVCRTFQHTGRSPNDKFFVRESSSESHIAWGDVNRPMAPEHFAALRDDVFTAIADRDAYSLDCLAGADARYQLPIKIVTEYAWHSLFARNLLINPQANAQLENPALTIVDVPSFKADPARHGSRSDVVIAVNLGERLVIIAGTSYAGEIKKSVFTFLNYLLPLQGVLSMHCSANVGSAGDVALFFGLSGTGKTTLSSDPQRRLIGDDEHGWSDHGIFNFEGGCYAKTIRLSAEAEPQIYATTKRFGTVLENVAIDPASRELNLDDDRLTENTRAAYPISFIDNAVLSGVGDHPTNIFMLTADAFGVLPPIARLTPDAAMYHFLSGYTAKVAGTEKGVTEPRATFSTCFGAPFLPLSPGVYAKMLGERIDRHRSTVWLVNTGWSGGAYGTGARMKIAYTRAMITAALSGELSTQPMEADPVFGLQMPAACSGVPSDVLNPRRAWKSEAEYDRQAGKLAAMFADNFKRFSSSVSSAVIAAGPRVAAT